MLVNGRGVGNGQLCHFLLEAKRVFKEEPIDSVLDDGYLLHRRTK